MRIRNAARILLLDQDARVFLFHILDPYNPEMGTFWVTPGGGVEEGESYIEASKRELWEETGITQAEIGPCVWIREAVFHFEHGPVQAHERYFVVRVSSTEIDLKNFTDLEKESYRQHKWWTLEELLSTTEKLIPEQLPEVLPAIIAGDYPKTPIIIK